MPGRAVVLFRAFGVQPTVVHAKYERDLGVTESANRYLMLSEREAPRRIVTRHRPMIREKLRLIVASR